MCGGWGSNDDYDGGGDNSDADGGGDGDGGNDDNDDGVSDDVRKIVPAHKCQL